MRRSVLIILLAFFLVGCAGAGGVVELKPDQKTVTVFVTHVSDGDTIGISRPISWVVGGKFVASKDSEVFHVPCAVRLSGSQAIRCISRHTKKLRSLGGEAVRGASQKMRPIRDRRHPMDRRVRN